MKNPVVFCLIGPTASGKTQIAIELTQKYPLEIISVDAAMIYRGMDIGTAKPDSEILALAPHRLIDICDPAESYSAGQFCQDAVVAIEDILAKGKLPLLVGGTMLYFHALLNGLSLLPKGDLAIRTTINQEAKQIGWPALHAKLLQIDPIAAERIHPNDAQRISRALEIFYLTNKPWTSFALQRENYLTYPIVKLALWIENRDELHQRIVQRFDAMLAKGWIEEVEKLFHRTDLSDSTPAMRSVGYRQIWRYLNGQLTFNDMRELGIIATRQLAKRQMTWMRKFNDVYYIDGQHPEKLKNSVEKLFTCYT